MKVSAKKKYRLDALDYLLIGLVFLFLVALGVGVIALLYCVRELLYFVGGMVFLWVLQQMPKPAPKPRRVKLRLVEL